MILLWTYQCFHRIHCHSTSIAIYYTSPVLYVDSDDMIDVEILKISHATLARIGYFSTIIFSLTQNIKIYCLIPLKNSLFHTNIIVKHPTFGYRIGYG